MALSQVQCLDSQNVNSRVSESKPEFFYSEDQRLALEALISSGRDGFMDSVHAKGIREFLSEPELDWLARTAEAYRPGFEHPLQKSEVAAGPGNLTPASVDDALSLQYWPDLSEASVAELDLGWPDSINYRGITRVAVHMQPPIEGHTHIKEVVRKTIAAASKVIAVVMDAFTDVDIFRDMLDASFKRKIPVYIIIDHAAVPCFLAMCSRADMHRGHLKNLRVRSCGGVEFHTRVAQKVCGSLNQRFLLVDGDRAISGSYSYTWLSSRLDRNLITVITGQVVESFDQQFRDLYLTSRGVSLSKVPFGEEPAPDPVLHSAPVPVSAAVARKLINPKYALVTSGKHASPGSSNQNSSNKTGSKNPLGLIMLKGRIREEVEAPPLHPGLAHLEKAYMINYLPTWPEPDPPRDVIGFINIRDDKRAHQVHLQRSEMFETSQAIRFSSPFTSTPEPELVAPAVPRTDLGPFQTHDVPAAPTEPSVQPVADPTHTPPEPEPADQIDAVAPAPADTVPPRGKPPSRDPSPLKTLENEDNSDSLSSIEASEPGPEVPMDAATVTPPVPKPRTLQLVIEPAHPSALSSQPQISLVRKIHIPEINAPQAAGESSAGPRGRLVSHRGDKDSGDGSQDSTKVMCDDPAAHENPSSVSTASEGEEFYECNPSEPGDGLTNGGGGGGTGSGHGGRHGDGLNVMARFSQSMLDLRPPSKQEDGRSLIQQSQQLRRGSHQSPHRHIGQLFQSSRSPGQGPKVIVAKPGSYHRPGNSSTRVIGGHRYWQGLGQQMHMDSDRGRASRSPRRHSPGYRKEGNAGSTAQPTPSNPTGFLGVSFSKLGHLKHLKTRAGGVQKKASYSLNEVQKNASHS